MKKITFTLLFIITFTFQSFAQGFFEHTVKAGESVASIVQKYEVSPYEIYQLNPDAKEGLTSGMVLVFLKNSSYPFDARLIDIKKYKVGKNEKSEDIAAANNIDVATLKKYNPKLYSEPAHKGCKLKIPVFSNAISDATTSNIVEVVTVSTTTNAVNHKVLPKETKYGIAKQYKLTIAELERLNPQIKEGLKEGQILKITKAEQVVVTTDNNEVVENKYEYYTVKAKEGFYRLTKKLGITKEELIALNPLLKEGIKLGMLLKYSKKDKAVADKVVYNLADSITNHNMQHVTFLLPLRLHKIVTTDSTTTNLKKLIKRDKVMNIALDFYTGAQLAIDSLKQLGINTRVNVLDTKYGADKSLNKKRINEIIATNFQENEIIIGPIVPSNIKPIANGLADKKVTILAPFSLKSNYKAANFCETSASLAFQRKKMIAYLENDVKNKQFIIVADTTVAQIKKELIAKFPLAKIVTPRANKNGLLIPKDFDGILSKEKENVVLIETKKVGLVATVVSILDTKLSTYKIKIATTSSQKQFDNKGIANRYKTKLNYHFPSVYKIKEFDKGDKFLEKYKQTYGKYPNRYALRGFDLTFDILLRQANKETLAQALLEIGETTYIENKFNYAVNTTEGFTNTAIYILHYTPNFQIEEVIIEEAIIEEKEIELVAPQNIDPVLEEK